MQFLLEGSYEIDPVAKDIWNTIMKIRYNPELFVSLSLSLCMSASLRFHMPVRQRLRGCTSVSLCLRTSDSVCVCVRRYICVCLSPSRPLSLSLRAGMHPGVRRISACMRACLLGSGFWALGVCVCACMCAWWLGGTWPNDCNVEARARWCDLSACRCWHRARCHPRLL